MPGQSAKLISKANAARIYFLKTEVDTGLSFARMAARTRSRRKPRPGDAAKIKRYMGYASQAYDVISSHVGKAKGERGDLRTIKEKFADLQKMLEQF